MINLEVNHTLSVIESNYDLVKASLKDEIERYKGLVVTEEDLKNCKADQKDLASLRVRIDNYRKEVKKEALKPVEKFEDQCKELIGLVSEVEIPLKEGIAVFDQKKKDEKRKIAEDIIKAAITEHGLNEKYSVQLTIIDKYCNLTAKVSDVKNDVEQRLFLLLQEQENEAEVLQIMKDTIERVNKDIDAKLSMEDFQSLLDAKASPVKVMQEITARAERIKVAEADKKSKAEAEIQERIARAEREAAAKATEEERRRIHEQTKASAEVAEEPTPIIKKEEIPNDHGNFEAEFEPVEEKYFVQINVTGSLEKITALSKFLKENNYDYIVLRKGRVAEGEA